MHHPDVQALLDRYNREQYAERRAAKRKRTADKRKAKAKAQEKAKAKAEREKAKAKEKALAEQEKAKAKAKTIRQTMRKRGAAQRKAKKKTEKRKAKAAARRALLAACADITKPFYAKGCLLCGESALCCMNAHHINPKAKSFSISKAKDGGITPEELVAEINKCVCLCMNCHRKVHAGVIDLAMYITGEQLRLVV